MDTARAFIALLICGIWQKLRAERTGHQLESFYELAGENRDRNGVLLIVRRRCFLRGLGAAGEIV